MTLATLLQGKSVTSVPSQAWIPAVHYTGGGIRHRNMTGHRLFQPTEGSGLFTLAHNICSKNGFPERLHLNNYGLTFSEATVVKLCRVHNPRPLDSRAVSRYCLNSLHVTSFDICNQILNYSPINAWKCLKHLAICSPALNCTPR